MEIKEQVKVMEFAHFQVKDELLPQYIENYPSFRSALHGLDGFEHLLTYQNEASPLELLDFAQWQSIEAAKAADQLVQNNPEYSRFFQSMEKVILFENTHMIFEKNHRPSSPGSKVAWFAYDIHSHKMEDFHPALIDFSTKVANAVDGFQHMKVFQSVEHPHLIFELLFFASNEALEHQFQLLETTDEFKRYVSCIRELRFRKFLKRIEL